MRYQIKKILKVMTLFEVLCKTSQKRLLKRLLLYPILKFVHRNVVFCDNVHIYSGIFRETIGYRNRSHFFFNVVIRDITTAKDLTLLSAMCIRNTTLHSCIATNAQVYW